MSEWLNTLLDNKLFDLIGAPIISSVLGGWLIYDFIKTRRAVRRREPIRVWYLRYPVYPEDYMYSYYVWQREYPAIMLFITIGLIASFFSAVFIWGGVFCAPRFLSST
jgi:hypothetical protein